MNEPEVGNEVLTDYPVEYVEETDTEYDTVTIIGMASMEVVHTE